MRLSDVFDNPKLYELFQYGVARPGTPSIIRDEVLKPIGVQKVMDFGSGIGYHSRIFDKSEYLGIEPLEGCVKRANNLHHAPNRKFLVGDHRTLKKIPSASFDLVIAIGVLHHIDDETFSEFIKESYRILRTGGRLTTFDPVLHENQSVLSRWVVKRDRGKWVRAESEYSAIIASSFPRDIKSKIYSGLLRIPYDHVAFTLIK